MTRKEFFEKCLDILLQQDFAYGIPLFECEDIDDYYIGNEDADMKLSDFLDLLYDEMEVEE